MVGTAVVIDINGNCLCFKCQLEGGLEGRSSTLQCYKHGSYKHISDTGKKEFIFNQCLMKAIRIACQGRNIESFLLSFSLFVHSLQCKIMQTFVHCDILLGGGGTLKISVKLNCKIIKLGRKFYNSQEIQMAVNHQKRMKLSSMS